MNKRIVFSGGPRSGKTTIIEELAKRNYSYIREFAREVISERKDLPLTKEEHKIRQRMMFDRQIEAEKKLLPYTNDFVFLDRSVVDVQVYHKYWVGEDFPFPEGFSYDGRYDKIFIFDMLRFEKDGVRLEDKEDAENIHNLLIKEYERSASYVAKVPVMSIEKRVQFILDRI